MKFEQERSADMDFDKDLAARQEARSLCRAARQAQKKLSEFPQEKLDKIVEAAAKAGAAAAAEVGKVKLCEVIARPHPEVMKFLTTG